MTIYRDPPRCKFGFRSGDIVLTPLGRRALLVRYRPDEKWDARYLAAINGSFCGAVVLNADTIKHE